MRIYSLSKIISFPIVLLLIILLYCEYQLEYDMGLWIFLPIIFLVMLYISYEDVDHWYLNWNPLKLDDKVIVLIKKYSPFYNALNEEERQKFEIRLSKYITGRSFKSVGTELRNVPYDIKAMLASCAIQLTFHYKDFLIGDFDRIFLYKHPFGSPQYQFLHTVETEVEDGVIIFSLEHAIPGITNPEVYYNIVMHGYVDAFTKANPNAPFPYHLNADWEDISAISGLTQKQILATIGFENVDLFVVLATCYFVYPKAFESRLPNLTKDMKILFGGGEVSRI